MSPRVEPVAVQIRWDPNVEKAVLVSAEEGTARLFLPAHPDDPDRAPVEIVWSGAMASRMEASNDEARSGHPLYDAGLRDVPWLGEVLDSQLIEELERRNRVHPRHDPSRFTELRHWIVPLKGCTVEVVASSFEVRRRQPR